MTTAKTQKKKMLSKKRKEPEGSNPIQDLMNATLSMDQIVQTSPTTAVCPFHQDTKLISKQHESGSSYFFCLEISCAVFGQEKNMADILEFCSTKTHASIRQVWDQLVCFDDTTPSMRISQTTKNPGRVYLTQRDEEPFATHPKFFQWLDVPLRKELNPTNCKRVKFEDETPNYRWQRMGSVDLMVSDDSDTPQFLFQRVGPVNYIVSPKELKGLQYRGWMDEMCQQLNRWRQVTDTLPDYNNRVLDQLRSVYEQYGVSEYQCLETTRHIIRLYRKYVEQEADIPDPDPTDPLFFKNAVELELEQEELKMSKEKIREQEQFRRRNLLDFFLNPQPPATAFSSYF